VNIQFPSRESALSTIVFGPVPRAIDPQDFVLPSLVLLSAETRQFGLRVFVFHKGSRVDRFCQGRTLLILVSTSHDQFHFVRQVRSRGPLVVDKRPQIWRPLERSLRSANHYFGLPSPLGLLNGIVRWYFVHHLASSERNGAVSPLNCTI
jgi:hypothetical protein